MCNHHSDFNPTHYPGIGAGWHIFHALMTFLFTCGLWAVVWIIHPIVKRARWDAQVREFYRHGGTV